MSGSRSPSWLSPPTMPSYNLPSRSYPWSTFISSIAQLGSPESPLYDLMRASSYSPPYSPTSPAYYSDSSMYSPASWSSSPMSTLYSLESPTDSPMQQSGNDSAGWPYTMDSPIYSAAPTAEYDPLPPPYDPTRVIYGMEGFAPLRSSNLDEHITQIHGCTSIANMMQATDPIPSITHHVCRPEGVASLQQSNLVPYDTPWICHQKSTKQILDLVSQIPSSAFGISFLEEFATSQPSDSMPQRQIRAPLISWLEEQFTMRQPSVVPTQQLPESEELAFFVEPLDDQQSGHSKMPDCSSSPSHSPSTSEEEQ